MDPMLCYAIKLKLNLFEIYSYYTTLYLFYTTFHWQWHYYYTYIEEDFILWQWHVASVESNVELMYFDAHLSNFIYYYYYYYSIIMFEIW